jgi:hypothetical protein
MDLVLEESLRRLGKPGLEFRLHLANLRPRLDLAELG